MLNRILATIPPDSDLPARAYRLTWLTRVFDGTIYDALMREFHEERDVGGTYIPIQDRKPSVRSLLCRTVVEDSVALLFGEGRFPEIDCDDRATRETLRAILKDARIPQAMTDAAMRGSVGSVAVLLAVLRDRAFVEVMPATYLTPVWQPDAPDMLLRVIEQYKARGDALRAAGYDIADSLTSSMFWMRREWDASAETAFVPLTVSEQKLGKPFVVDPARTVIHKLGFVPIVWMRNLPGGDAADGACTFRPAIETSIEIDYQLSQAGRGLRYSSDPTLLIKEPAAQGGPLVRSASQALIVSSEGDAKMLEINGTASAAVIEYVRALREQALESIHGNRASPDKMSAAQSGRALELMNQGLVWLADRLRSSYGEDGLLRLIEMIQRVSVGRKLKLRNGKLAGAMDADATVSLRWPSWFPPTEEDKMNTATTLTTLTNGGIMSRPTALANIAATFDVEDQPHELALIAADQAAEDARLKAQAAQVNAGETI